MVEKILGYMLDFDGGGSALFMMKGKIIMKKKCLVIDSGFLVTIISYKELQEIIHYDVWLGVAAKRRKVRGS